MCVQMLEMLVRTSVFDFKTDRSINFEASKISGRTNAKVEGVPTIKIC